MKIVNKSDPVSCWLNLNYLRRLYINVWMGSIDIGILVVKGVTYINVKIRG